MELVRNNLRTLFYEGVAAVHPRALLLKKVNRCGDVLHVADNTYLMRKNCYVVGFGKAVLGMAATLERILAEHLIHGIVSVPQGIQEMFKEQPEQLLQAASKIRVMEGAPGNLPDCNAMHAADEIMNLVSSLDANTLLFVLISGGGSSLLPMPAPGLTLRDKLDVIHHLTVKGASIVELNMVRKKLSATKGGRLAIAAYPAETVVLILSDVIDNLMDIIASGPTCPNTDDHLAAMSIIQKYSIEKELTAGVLEALNRNEPVLNIPTKSCQFSHVDNLLIGDNQVAMNAMHELARRMGYVPLIFHSGIHGDAARIGSLMSQFTYHVVNIMNETVTLNTGELLSTRISSFFDVKLSECFPRRFVDAMLECKRFRKGLCVIFGGETTVQVVGTGLGGRNQEVALSFALRMNEMPPFVNAMKMRNYNICLLSAGTDGIDGPTSAAGAMGYYEQINMSYQQRMNAKAYLDNNDTHSFYRRLYSGQDLIITGHTGTNVMDIQLLVIEPKLSSSHI